MSHRDFVTILTTKDKERPTKVWSDWAVKPRTGTPYKYKPTHVDVDSIEDIYRLLVSAAPHDSNVIVRGRAKDDIVGTYAQRLSANFDDVPHHWMMIDVDNFVPVICDAADSEGASQEYIATHLPAPFQGRSFVWHCSASAGVPSSAGRLKMHLFFWLSAARDSASLKSWADAFGAGVMDRSIYNSVQQHFIANPKFVGDLDDPVGIRTGLWKGNSDEVSIDIADAAAADARGADAGSALVNPAMKDGLIGRFHRVITVDDVLDTILPGMFDRVEGDDRRLTWLGASGGAREGAWISDDRMHIGATHDSWPFGAHRLANLWDIVRVFRFGDADIGADELLVAIGPHALPSQDAMVRWSSRLVEQREGAVADGDGDGAGSGSGSGGDGDDAGCFGGITRRILKSIARAVGVDAKVDADVKALGVDINYNARAICRFVSCSYWHPKSGMFTVVHAGQEKYFARGDLSTILRDFVPGGVADIGEVGARAESWALDSGLPQVAVARAVKHARGIVVDSISEYIMVYRQATEVAVEVDMFDRRPRVAVSDGRATIVYAHRPLLVADEPDMRYVTDFMEHFPEFDDLLSLMAAARFASSRKNAYLWLNAPSNFGKSLLMDLLKRGGLVVETSVSDIERMISGSPSGKTLSSFRHAWVLAIDEFKTVRSELKQLTESITFAPKNMPACTVELYLKLFLSAEHVEAMGSEHTGIEEQFSNRFSIISAEGSIDARPLFVASKYTYKQHLYAYIATRLNAEVERYVAMGRKASSDAAETYIKAFHTKHRFGDGASTMNQKVPELTQQFSDWVKYMGAEVVAKNGSRGLSMIEHTVGENIVVATGDALYLKKPYKLIETWIDSEFSKSEGGAVRHKRKAIHDALGVTVPTRCRVLTSHSLATNIYRVVSLQLNLADLMANPFEP